MPGCPNGADPSPAGRDTQQLLDVASLTASLVTLFRSHAPTSIAGFTASLVDVNALCQLNPDPPRELTPGDFVANLAYMPGSLPGVTNPLTQWLYEWLRYQAFLNFCVCKAVVPDPTLNCFHGVNLSWGSGQNVITPLGTVQIEQAVYATWLNFPDGTQRIAYNLGKVTTSGLSGASNWAVQVLGADGLWVDLWRGDAFPEGSHGDGLFTLNAQVAPLPNPVQLRVRSTFGGASTLASLDVCFRPLTAAPQPLPPDPSVPNLPTVPPPLCSTDDLCAIVQELSRQLSRVSGQVADIQASIGATDVLVQLDSHPIAGEGEITVALGTRAVLVELTTLGSSVYTSALGRPRGLMRAGSVRWGTGSGYTSRTFIDGERVTFDRPEGGLSVSYQLLEGTSGTLRCLG